MESASSIIQEWEKAGTTLSAATANFLILSNLLEKSSLPADNTSNLVARIDFSVQALHTALDQQLVQARVAVAKTRNRLASPMVRFPEEILSEIFMCNIYDRGDDLIGFSSMEKRVQSIYQRLHNLLGVCTVWRNICITRQVFWSIIPMVDPIFGHGFPRIQQTELSLQRAGNQGLDLAVFLQDHPRYPKDTRLAALIPHFPRFRTANVYSGSRQTVFQVLTMLLQHGMPEMISELSLCHLETYATPHMFSTDYRFNHEESLVLDQFSRLMSSLSVLRINNIIFDWKTIKFSSRLVELRLNNITLPGTLWVHSFMNALSTAYELRGLTIKQVEAFLDQGTDMLPSLRIPLPKLESLYLSGLCLNVMETFLTSITSRSYYLALSLSVEAGSNLNADLHLEDVTFDNICELLARFPVKKLILGHDEGLSSWLTASNLPTLLKSVPTLQHLILKCYKLDKDLLKALEPQQMSQPRLQMLELWNVSIFDDGEGLKGVVAGHAIQNLVFGGYFRRDLDEDSDKIRIEGGDEIVQWLHANVSKFHFIKDAGTLSETMVENFWRLWGL